MKRRIGLIRERSSSSSSAFTVLELLVVIAVIAVLLIISVPAVHQMRASSQNVRCLANLRACGQGIMVHGQENKGRLVLPWASNLASDTASFPELINHPQSGFNWCDYLIERGYLARDVIVCPTFAPYRYTEKPWGMAYGMRRTDSGTRYQPVTLSKVERPNSFVLLADSSRPTSAKSSQWYYITYPGNGSDTMHFRHADRANILFLDGSSRGLTTQEVLDLNDGWRAKAFDTSSLP